MYKKVNASTKHQRRRYLYAVDDEYKFLCIIKIVISATKTYLYQENKIRAETFLVERCTLKIILRIILRSALENES